MSIDLISILEETAKMAHIDLTYNLKTAHAKLTATLENIKIINSIDTTNSKLFTHKNYGEASLREDETNFKSQSIALAKLSKNFHKDGYQVPKILAKSGE